VGGRIDQELSVEIKDAVHSVENIQVGDLMELRGYVRQASSVWPARFVVPARQLVLIGVGMLPNI
jgi:hypothetical protein